MSLYEVLGVAKDASRDEVEDATAVKSRQLQQAYDILSNPIKRAKYDLHGTIDLDTADDGGEDASGDGDASPIRHGGHRDAGGDEGGADGEEASGHEEEEDGGDGGAAVGVSGDAAGAAPASTDDDPSAAAAAGQKRGEPTDDGPAAKHAKLEDAAPA